MSMPNNALLTLYSNPTCPDSHRVRFLASEKENLVEIINIFPHDLPEELINANPYGTLPTLIDKDVVLRDAQVMMEYLDERFPSPTFMPVDPITRAKVRMMLVDIRESWLPHFMVLNDMKSSEKKQQTAIKEIGKNLLELKPTFGHYKFCMTNSFTLVDISLSVILWRLDHYGIDYSHMGIHFNKYMREIFSRKAFAASLSLFEENMRLIPETVTTDS